MGSAARKRNFAIAQPLAHPELPMLRVANIDPLPETNDSAASIFGVSSDIPISLSMPESPANSVQLPLVSNPSHGEPEPLALPPGPSEELAAEIKLRSAELETATPQEILRWTVERFGKGLTMATAFGPEGMCIIHMLSEIDPSVHMFNLDTGYQFTETLELRERVLQRYGIAVEMKQPETTVEQYELLHGGPLYKTNPDQCCFDRKIKILRQAAQGFTAWMSAIRRDQSPDRAKAAIVSWDKKFGLVKVNPLANWTKQQVWKLITDSDIPYNPLHDQGFTSIGCKPCTRSVMFGEDERAGRWSGFAKTECGLHTATDEK